MPAPVDSSDEPRTVVIPVDNVSVADYLIPPGILQYIQSVLIEVDNGGGPAVRPTLRIKEQSGVVIAAKRQGESIPAGDTGTATWALRLTDETEAAAPAGDTGASSRWVADESHLQTIPDATLTPIHWESATFNTLGITTADGEVFDLPGIGANPLFQWTIRVTVHRPTVPGPFTLDMGVPGSIVNQVDFPILDDLSGSAKYKVTATGPIFGSAGSNLFDWSLLQFSGGDVVIGDRRFSVSYLGQWQ